MQARLFSILPALAAVAFLGFGIAHADDAKDAKAPEAKKACDGAGCKDDKAAKPDEAKQGEAKKDEEDCKDGCCSKPAETVSAKQMKCADCDKVANGPCDKCKTAVKTGAVAVLPIKGMMCPSCETGLAKKIDGIDQVAKFLVSSDKNVAVLVIAPGKTLKLADLSKTLAGTKFSVDEESPLVGRITLTVANGDCPACPMCGDEKADKTASTEKDCCEDVRVGLAEVKGVEKCTATKLDGADKAFTIQLAEGSTITLKQIREKVGSFKKHVGDFVFTGVAAVEEVKKSSS